VSAAIDSDAILDEHRHQLTLARTFMLRRIDDMIETLQKAKERITDERPVVSPLEGLTAEAIRIEKQATEYAFRMKLVDDVESGKFDVIDDRIE
jgi:hypothetical protein